MTKPIQVKNIILGEGMPKICVPLTESKTEEICTQAVRRQEQSWWSGEQIFTAIFVMRMI